MINLDDLRGTLRSKGYKLTPQRRSVLKVMIQHTGEHLTAEEIYDEVRVECPDIGLATVYRTLQLLNDLKVLMKLNLEDGITRYEMNLDERHHHHHHLICENCGIIIEVKYDLLDSVEKKIEKEYDFKIQNHKLKFYGLCNNCQSNC